jgi:hypothetical protein
MIWEHWQGILLTYLIAACLLIFAGFFCKINSSLRQIITHNSHEMLGIKTLVLPCSRPKLHIKEQISSGVLIVGDQSMPVELSYHGDKQHGTLL